MSLHAPQYNAVSRTVLGHGVQHVRQNCVYWTVPRPALDRKPLCRRLRQRHEDAQAVRDVAADLKSLRPPTARGETFRSSTDPQLIEKVHDTIWAVVKTGEVLVPLPGCR